MAINWNDCRLLDAWMWDMIYADYPRGLNRSRINSLANGSPPYTEEEVEKNKINVNTSDLTLTCKLHDARSQYANGFLTQGQYFTCKTDGGSKHKRSMWNQAVTRAANKPLKESVLYYEVLRSKFASLVLHGIAPAVWENEDKVIPRAMGVEDLLIPGDTLIGFENLPMFALRRSFTAHELHSITKASKRDKGWNIPLVNRCMEWADTQMAQLQNNNWPEYWKPEKWQERFKQDDCYLAGDQVPTIDTFDIYGYVDGDGKHPAGWVRRVILDSWSQPAVVNGQVNPPQRRKDMKDRKGKSLEPVKDDDFLFSSGDAKSAENWNHILSVSYADLSAVAPFRYHSVRALGWLLYAPCHLRNRLVCKTYEAVFESLIQYFKVKSMDDVQRAMKLELANLGFIDETITPVPANERWQPNAGLIELGLGINQQIIDTNAKSFTGQPGQSQGKERESNFQRMADLQALNALVSAGLTQSYQYQAYEYREIFRRLMKESSKDPMSRKFREDCYRSDVPESLMNADAWEIQSERIMGNGNQTLSMMIAESLMQQQTKFDPESQRIVLRDFVFSLTQNAAKASELVPPQPVKVTPASHDAELACGAMFNSIAVEPMDGTNHLEYIPKALQILGQHVAMGMKSPSQMVDSRELQGMKLVADNIAKHIQMLGMDEQQKPAVKKFSDALAKLVNEIKAFEQRLQAAQKKQQAQQSQNGNGQPDPKNQAKIAATMMTAKAKSELAKQSHAQKTAQRQISFEAKLKQDAQQHAADIASKDLETAANIRRGGMESLNEGSDDE